MASIRISRLLRLGIAPVALAALVLAGASAAREQVVSARAEITGSGTSYRLTWTNTGDQHILCAGLLLTGVQPTSASGPPGVLTRVGTFQGRGLVHMQGTPSTPAVPAGGNVTRARSLAPSATAVVNFTTNVAIRPNAGGEIRYSATCLPNSDEFGQANGPPPPPPPPPPPVPCNCQNLAVVGGKYSSSQVNTGVARLKLTLTWTLTCAGVPGKTCTGRIEIQPPAGSDLKLATPKNRNVKCAGRCSGPPSTTRGTARMEATSAKDLYFDERAGKSFRFRLRLWCTRGGKEVLVGSKRMTFAFGSGGFLDKRKSDLNGNGVADGKEK